MSTANSGTVPLAQVAQVIVELAKSKKKLEDLTHGLKKENAKSAEMWRDSKGDEFRGKIKEIVALNTRVGDEMGRQIRVLQEFYKTQYEAAQKVNFDTGKI